MPHFIRFFLRIGGGIVLNYESQGQNSCQRKRTRIRSSCYPEKKSGPLSHHHPYREQYCQYSCGISRNRSGNRISWRDGHCCHSINHHCGITAACVWRDLAQDVCIQECNQFFITVFADHSIFIPDLLPGNFHI